MNSGPFAELYGHNGHAAEVPDDYFPPTPADQPGIGPLAAAPLSLRQLVAGNPELRPPIIHGLLREGETMNIIAPPKLGKSWLVYDLAISVATGRAWLGTFQTVRGDVLILDNELHPSTSASRIPKVVATRGLELSDVADHVYVESLRGKLKDIYALGKYFASIEPGRFKMIIVDAFYRTLPRDVDENDNGQMANVYNTIDQYADRLGCAFVLIHHSSKGSQADKAVTDVGSGAGSQSRAADAHLVLRHHETDGAVVLDAAVRSRKPIESVALRWAFPVWNPAPDLDPTRLKRANRGRPSNTNQAADAPKLEPWTPERFVSEFVKVAPQTKDAIIGRAVLKDLSGRKACQLLSPAGRSRRRGSGRCGLWDRKRCRVLSRARWVAAEPSRSVFRSSPFSRSGGCSSKRLNVTNAAGVHRIRSTEKTFITPACDFSENGLLTFEKSAAVR